MREQTISGEIIDNAMQSKSTLELAKLEPEGFFPAALKKKVTELNKQIEKALELYRTGNWGQAAAEQANSGKEALEIIQNAKASLFDAVIAEEAALSKYLELDTELREVYNVELKRLATEQHQEHEKTLAAMQNEAGVDLKDGLGRRDIMSKKEEELEKQFKALRKRRSDMLNRGVVDRRLAELDGKLMEVIRDM